MQGVVSLIVALIIVVQVIGGIVTAVQKKQKEREQLAQLEERRRRMEAARRGQPAGAQGPTDASGPSTITPQQSAHSSMSDLQARRQAQLEELRTRREARRGGSHPAAQPQHRVSSTGAQLKPQVPPHMGPPSARAGSQRSVQPVQVRQQPRRSPQPVQSKQAARSQLQSRTRQQSSIKSETVGQRTSTAGAGLSDSGIHDASLQGIRTGRFNRRALREAIIMKELLDPPVSLRDQAI